MSCVLLVVCLGALSAGQNLVANGSFENTGAKADVPAAWTTSGNRDIVQQLVIGAGRDGKRCARLICSQFREGGPDHHAMLGQVGKVAVQSGHWYQLAFWARAKDLKEGAVEISLVNTRVWNNVGLAEAFRPRSTWQRFAFVFRARDDLAAESSRLQMWFKSTGELWLDDVELVETPAGQRWLPTIQGEGVKNLVPNSSFECGTANWGSFTWGLGGWAGNLYRLEGELDEGNAHHGQASLKIALQPRNYPVYWFDYYQPVRQPVKRVLAANHGWFAVEVGKPLTLSAYLKADQENVAGQLVVQEANGRMLSQKVTVGKAWQRQQFTVRPQQAYVFIAVGLDLEASKRDAATLWVDAVQLERGATATAYEPRHEVETFVETNMPGNLFTDVARGLGFQVRAFNNGATEQTITGKLKVTDFFDQDVLTQAVTLTVPAHQHAQTRLIPAAQGKRGFFRAQWTTPKVTQSLRCAVLEPIRPTPRDSFFGFNHAYPWDFLVERARDAGVVWWRDWSMRWDTVEPEKGRWDFTIPDEQIQRLLKLDCQVEILLPFPSAKWSTSMNPKVLQTIPAGNTYLRSRIPLAFAPKNGDDFGTYAAEVVKRYKDAKPHSVTHYQILNEPVYTNYSLPRQYGYGLSDYVKLLDIAYRRMKAVDSSCRIVGGISAGLSSRYTSDFIKEGGLRHLDVSDLHIYDPDRPVESYTEPYVNLQRLQEKHGGEKPVWITEYGCYADDDPPSIPSTFGDDTMNRCSWPSERAATEHIVKFATVSMARGVRKIFFHAGVCGTINGADAGGILFEYGGTPRRMYAGVHVFNALFGVPKAWHGSHPDPEGFQAHLFHTSRGNVGIAWNTGEKPRKLALVEGVQAFDLMGNEVRGKVIAVTESPVYLVARDMKLLHSVCH